LTLWQQKEIPVGLRETLNKNPALTSAVAGVLVVLAIVYIFWSNKGGQNEFKPVTQYYYTVDDGKTLFADSKDKIVPFMKDGKEAVKARVFRCGSKGKPQTAWLEKYTPAGKAEMEKYAAQNQPGQPRGRNPAEYDPKYMLVKKPLTGAWVNVAEKAAEATKIRDTGCPDSDETAAEEVYPDQE
jgi:hypothetical protein